jgi:hypothetical protein
MTKVQLHFRIVKPLDDAMMQHLSDASALYGIQQVKMDPSMQKMTVEYDATRLRPEEVEAALAGAGIAVVLA